MIRVRARSFDARVALVDPVCGSSGGHNFPTLCKYRDWLASRGLSNVALYVPTINNSAERTATRVVRSLPWIFDPYIPVVGSDQQGWLDRLSRRFRLEPSSSWYVHFLERKVLLIKHLRSIVQLYLALRAMSRRKIDIVFFPGADFYSAVALYWLSKTRLSPPFACVVLRFMSVMETSQYHEFRGHTFISYTKKLLRTRMSVTVTAETEKYAAVLSTRLKARVTVTGIPVNTSLATIANLDPFPSPAKKLTSLGGARKDKGYFLYLEISKWLQESQRESMLFQFQRMDPSQPQFDPVYEAQLRAQSNVRQLSPRLSDAELESRIAESDVLVLAYDPETYLMRGSAILFDSLRYGKPLLGRAGTAFGLTIETKGLGLTFQDKASFLAAVDRLVNPSREEHRRIQQGCSEYQNELERNLQEAFSLAGDE